MLGRIRLESPESRESDAEIYDSEGETYQN